MDLSSRIATLMQKTATCDVTFIVGDTSTNIECHKLILAAGSQVFEAMFYGGFAESSSVIIPDVTVVGFESMLQYLYTDKVTLEKEDDALEIAYAAKKYMIQPLFESCEKHILKKIRITEENVFTLYEEASYLEMKEIQAMCLRFLSRNAKKIFRSKSFENASSACLEDILQLDIMDIDSECDLIEALWYWGSSRCLTRGMECTRENVKRFTKGFLKHIRLQEVTVEDLAKVSSRNKDSISDLAERMAAKLKIRQTKETDGSVAQSEFRSRSITNSFKMIIPVEYQYSGSLSTLFIVQHNQRLHISTDKQQITLVGMTLAFKPVPCYSPDHRTLDIEVSVCNTDSGIQTNAKIALKSTSKSNDEQQHELFLDEYVVIAPGQSVIVDVVLNGEGVLVTECTKESFVDDRCGARFEFCQDRGTQRIVFPVKNILYM